MKKVVKICLGFIIASILLSGGYAVIVNDFKIKEVDLDNDFIIKQLKKKETVFNIINDSSAFPSTMRFVDDSHFNIFFDDLIVYEISTKNNLNFKNLSNTSYKSSIFSLAALRNYLLENNLNKSQIVLIDKYVKGVIEYSNAYWNSDSYVLHDHPVSERLETLFLYVSYKLSLKAQIHDYEIEHIKHLIYLLMQEDYFSYYINHGLIQLKALLRTGVLLENKAIINKSKEFLKDVYDIYVSSDGSILESASQYQLYIHLLFKEYNRLLTLIGDDSLEKKIFSQQDTLSALIASNGFFQAYGDSYNTFTHKIPVLENPGFFSFNNGIAGVNLSKQNFNILFISLDNKPNVHKLPEDLSIYIYFDGPFFINTGTYSYNDSDLYRKLFLQRKSQNGVKFIKEDLVSSAVKIDKSTDTIAFSGYAVNKDNDSLFRHITLDLKNSKMKIKDYAKKENLIYSNFILHPSVKYTQLDNNTIRLDNRHKVIIAHSQSEIKTSNHIISKSLFQIDTTTMLQTEGNNILEFRFADIICLDSLKILNEANKTKNNLRSYTIEKLKQKYSLTFNIRKINTAYTCSLGGLFLISLMSYFIRFNYIKMFAFFLFIVLILNIFQGGEFVVVWTYNVLSFIK